eukprot:1156013-Pelagomonas_calceolata.AAC.10
MPELHGTSQRQVNVLQQKPLCHPARGSVVSHQSIQAAAGEKEVKSTLELKASGVAQHNSKLENTPGADLQQPQMPGSEE